MNSETGNSDSYLITDSNIEEPSENGIVNPLYDDTNSPIAGSQQHAAPERPNIQAPVKLDINGGSGLRGESSWLEEGHVIHAQHNIHGASPSVLEMPSGASAEMQEIASDSIQRFPEHTRGNQDSRSEKNRSRKESKCFQRCPPWRVVLTCVACFTVEFTLGVSYTAGNMLPYLTSYMRERTDPSVEYTVTMWIGAGHTFAQCSLMSVFGLLEKRLWPWLFRLLGIIFFCGSYFGGSWAIRTSFPLTVLTLGVMQGCGQAILYPASLNLALRWLPARRGLVGGLIMGGFGGGAFLWNQVVTTWINPNNLQPDIHDEEDLYYSQTEVLDNVPTCYLLLGGIMSGIQLLCLLSMSNPPDPEREGQEGQEVQVMDPSVSLPATDQLGRNVSAVGNGSIQEDTEEVTKQQEKGDMSPAKDYTPRQVLRSRVMWTITMFYFFSDIGVLILTDFYKAYGQTFVHNDRLLSIMGSVASVVNSAGRPFWGFLADHFGFQMCLVTVQAILAVVASTFMLCEFVGASMLFVWICLIFFTVAGMYGMGSPLIFTLFGSSYFNFNLGILAFSANFGSLISIYVTKAVKELLGWHGLFLVAGVFAFVGMLINVSLQCQCGQPMPGHMKRVLFNPKPKERHRKHQPDKEPIIPT